MFEFTGDAQYGQPQYQHTSEILEEENQDLTNALGDKVQALKSVSYKSKFSLNINIK